MHFYIVRDALLLVAAAAVSNAAYASDWIGQVSLTTPEVLKVDPIVNNTTRTVLFPVYPGTDLHALAPTFSVAGGVHVNPRSGSTVDLAENVTYTLRSRHGSTAKWTMSAVEMRSPVIPGYYADPNIAAFGNKYYIYATTDGFPGWGGQVFYVWSSENLVDWNRSAQPILTLNGTNGNVPWANGNAWAPTIIERDGKYFLYFSGNNPTYDWKTIGVAVASSPDGPFVAEPKAMILNTEKVNASQAIDPAAFLDKATGTYYLYWGNGRALYAELADDMISLKQDTIKAVSGLTNFTEASFVVYREPFYHYTYSVGNTGDASYYVGYATAPHATGPWTYRGVLLHEDPAIEVLATGSNSILNVPGTDDWYIAYHRFHIPGGDGTHREITIDRLRFDKDTGIMKSVIPTLSSVKPRRIPH